MKFRILFFTLLLFSLGVSAQKIEGQIFEIDDNGENMPLLGASVYWANTTIGTSTNEMGYFTLNRSEGNTTLVISFVGYRSDTLTVAPHDTYIIHTLKSSVGLDEVTIKGSKPGAHFSRINPIQSQVVTRTELYRAACCNLSESFETNASVDVSYSDAVTGAKEIQLLGLAGNYTQIQVENIPTLRGLFSTFGLEHIPGNWMESIQISKGTASVANGYESIAGQINVEYKKPWEQERLLISSYGNSLGMGEAAVNYSAILSPKVSTMLLTHVENMSFENDHNHDSFLSHPLVKKYNILNRWKYDAEQFESQVGIRILDEERQAGQISNENLANPYRIGINTRQYEGFAKAGYIFNRPATSIGLVTSANRHDQSSFFGNTIYEGVQQSFYSNLIFVTYLGNTAHSIKTGMSFMYDDYSETLNHQPITRQEVVPGAYFEYTYKFLDILTFMGGIRYDNHNLFGNLVTPRMHIRFEPIDLVEVRTSVGKGYRSPNVIAENMYLLASSRNMVIVEDLNMEEAWNFGVNLVFRPKLWERELTLSTDFYHTNFLNQLVVDVDSDPNSALFYNLHGESFSNSFQTEASYKPTEQLRIIAAYRWNDVKSTINNHLVEKPLISRYKAFASASYETKKHNWQFDYTIHLNGGGRLPDTHSLPSQYQRDDEFPSFITMNAQILKKIRQWDAYIGMENITGYTQKNPIISADNPYSPFFDASMVWGPLTGQKVYFGFRYTISR